MTSEPNRARRDQGVTLIELLVGITLMALLTTALCGGLVVILRQSGNTNGRLNNSRSEQAVDTYLPTDLASASAVTIGAGDSPCEAACPTGVNVDGSSALMLTWDTVIFNGTTGTTTKYTRVSYRYVLVGSDWQLVRVECNKVGATGAYTCANRAVVHNLPAPPGSFSPGTTVPSWVIQVSIPLDPLDPGNTGTTMAPNPNAVTKGAQRVTVTINGGGSGAGAGGGVNQISLSAGGTTRGTIPANSTSGVPSFTAARSRCGGNIVLVVDRSGSIDGDMSSVIGAVKGFIDTFAGTPVKLEIIAFSSMSFAVGSTSWTNYTDMLNPSLVTALKSGVDALTASGGTNYEDAFLRVFKNQDGSNATIVPDMVVFFTDGVPTVNRTYADSSGNAAFNSGTGPTIGTVGDYPPPADMTLPAPNGYAFSQVSYNRTDSLIKQYRGSNATRFVGVGAGDAIDQAGSPDVSEFIDSGGSPGGSGFHYNYERGYHTSGQSSTKLYSSPYNSWKTGYLKAAYDAGNITADSSDGWRINGRSFSAPYDYSSSMVPNQVMLSRLLTASDTWGKLNADASNVRQVNMYFDGDYSKLPGILSSIALGECGGTLTIQTQLNGAAIGDPFTYQNTAIRSTTGAVQPGSGTTVTTNSTSKSGTFDFKFSSGQYVDVDIVPYNASDSSTYAPAGWTCTSGANGRSVTPVAISGSPWQGFTVRVNANESVSCIQKVTLK